MVLSYCQDTQEFNFSKDKDQRRVEEYMLREISKYYGGRKLLETIEGIDFLSGSGFQIFLRKGDYHLFSYRENPQGTMEYLKHLSEDFDFGDFFKKDLFRVRALHIIIRNILEDSLFSLPNEKDLFGYSDINSNNRSSNHS